MSGKHNDILDTVITSHSDVPTSASNADDEDDFEGEAIDLSGIKYRTGTTETDQLVLVLNSASLKNTKYTTQLCDLFYAYMVCVVGASIVTELPKMKLDDIYTIPSLFQFIVMNI